MLHTNVVEKIKIQFSRSQFIFENPAIYDNVEKYCTAWQTTDGNMARENCMLDT